MINNSLKTIILAAGESKRILSSKSKILHTIGGKVIIEHVLDNIRKVVNKKIGTEATSQKFKSAHNTRVCSI